MKKPVVLCILDGWGWREEVAHNAIAAARTPCWDRLVASCPMSLLEASEHYVGLPDGQMGNSEVGHMNIGGGRVVMQDLPKIDAAIESGALAENAVLRELIVKAKAGSGRVHLVGLLSPGGVHSHQRHLEALCRILDRAGLSVLVHGFLDGRDTPPQSAGEYVTAFEEAIAPLSHVTLATLGGRYYGMDRDKRWDRVEKAWKVMMKSGGEEGPDARGLIEAAYAAGVTDEFLEPAALGGYEGAKSGDAVLLANFRADRVRQITAALVDPDFDGFSTAGQPHWSAVATMSDYAASLRPFVTVLFPPEDIKESLGEVVAGAGLAQLRIAETEKYAHVTFFFNGGREESFEGEDRILIPSPKVATYDLKPEMAAEEVTDRLVEAIQSGKYGLITVNYANTDMVGHTGDFAAAVKAVEAVDGCLDRLERAVREQGGSMLITADHGNAECMYDPASSQPHTAHTLEKVPFLLVGGPAGARLEQGCLADIAPTVLDLMGLEAPQAMTGRSLLVN